MRVLLIGDYPPPYGGVAIHVQQLHRFLRDRGVEAKVLDIGKGGRPAPDVIPVQSLARFGLRLAGYSRVVAVSGAVKEALVGCGVPAAKILVQPAFCSSQVKPGPMTATVELARARRTPLLAMAHHPSPVYGRMVMFRALRLLANELPGVGLAVFGPGTRTPEFARDARETHVAPYLEDLGELDHEAVLGLLSRCDAFIRPTTHDGDAISVREALALGVPCVASDVCARPEGTYLFRAGYAPDLALRVRQALVEGAAETVLPDAGPVLLSLYAELSAPRLEGQRPAMAT